MVPHEAEDGTYFVDIIADESELKKLPKGDWDIDIREPRVIGDAAGQLSETNRYAEDGVVLRGVGTKETR